MKTSAADTKIYGTDYFTNEYAQGTIDLTWNENTTYHGYAKTQYIERDLGTYYAYNNQRKEEDKYIYFKDAIYYQGKYYDAKVYVWSNMSWFTVLAQNDANNNLWYCHPTNGSWHSETDAEIGKLPAPEDCVIHVQVEMQGLDSFKGVTYFDDLDRNEGWACDDLVDWYEHPGTQISINGNKALGTRANTSVDNIHLTLASDDNILDFVYYPYSGCGGAISSSDTKITYKIADSSEYGAGNIIGRFGVPFYSNYNVLQTDDIEGLQKTVTEGNRTYKLKEQWYSDANSTVESPSSVKIVTSPLTLYGTYYKCWNIDTYIQNGQITASEYGIDPGESRIVSWQAGPGYYVESVMIDGKSISIDDKNGGSYTFDDISSDHDVSVICEVAGTEITLTKTIAVDDIYSEHGNPTFLFKVDGTDVFGDTHTYYQSTEFDMAYVDRNSYTGADGKKYVDQTVTFDNMYRGNYTASEVGVSRYTVDTVSNVTSGTAKDGTAIFDLTDSGSGTATFTNAHTVYRNYSHNDSVINEIRTVESN